MILTAIQKTLDTRLKTVAGLPDVYTENMLSQPKTGSAWVRTTLLPARTAVASLGTQYTQRYSGLFQIDLFYPKDRGFLIAGAMADLVIGAFQPSLRLEHDDFSLLIEGSWKNTASPREQFYQVPVQIEWSTYK